MDVCPLHSGMDARLTELEHKAVAQDAALTMHQRTNGSGHVRRSEMDEAKEDIEKLKKWQQIATIALVAMAASNGALVGKLIQMLIQ